MTPLQKLILDSLDFLGGEATSYEIAEYIDMGHSPRSISMSCQYLRGEGYLTDGSTSQAIAGGMAWSPPPKGPIRWKKVRE